MITALAAEGGGPSSWLSEDLLREWVDLLVRLVEAAGAVIIVVGAVVAAVAFVRAALVSRSPREFGRVRLRLGATWTLVTAAVVLVLRRLAVPYGVRSGHGHAVRVRPPQR